MSFRIRNTYRPTYSGTNDDGDDSVAIQPMDNTLIQKAHEAIKNSRNNRNFNMIDLNAVIKNSSINPDISISGKKSIEQLLEQNKTQCVIDEVDILGSKKKQQQQQQQSINLGYVKEDEKKSDNQGNKLEDEKEDDSDDEAKTQEEKKLKDEIKQKKKMLRMSYPKQASMLRGHSLRVGTGSNGIKRTPYGIVDGF